MQAEGSNTVVSIANELTFKTAPEQVIHPCEAVWDELVDTDVTATAEAVDYKVGTKSLKLAVASACGAGDILATDSITSMSLASYTHVGMWVKSSVACDAADLKLLLDDTASCGSPLEAIDLPALVANTWTFVHLALANPATDLAIISVGLKMIVDKGAFNLFVDDIRAINPAVVFPIKTEDVSLSQELLRSEVLTATRNLAEPSLGNIAIDGPISTELAPYMVRMFKHMLGSCVVTGSGAPYTYTFKVAALPAGIQYEKGFTDIGKYFINNGVRVDTWKISCAAGKINPLELTFKAAKETVRTTSWDPTAISYLHHAFTAFKALIKEGAGGATLGTVTEFSIEGKNDLDGENYVLDGTGERYSMPAGKCTVTGNITSLFIDTVLYDLAKAGTPTKLVFEMWHGDGAALTAGNEKLRLTLDEVMLKPKAPPIDGPKGIKVSLDFEAYYSSGANASSLMLEVLLPVNTVLY